MASDGAYEHLVQGRLAEVELMDRDLADQLRQDVLWVPSGRQEDLGALAGVVEDGAAAPLRAGEGLSSEQRALRLLRGSYTTKERSLRRSRYQHRPTPPGALRASPLAALLAAAGPRAGLFATRCANLPRPLQAARSIASVTAAR